MRAVVQRVTEASVTVIDDGPPRLTASISTGLLVLVAVHTDDMEEDAVALAQKVAGLRVFEDENGKLNLSLSNVGGSALVVSNFTLYGDCRKGRRPSFSESAPAAIAEPLYRRFGATLSSLGIPTLFGEFGKEMRISLVNDGPVTLLLDSRRGF